MNLYGYGLVVIFLTGNILLIARLGSVETVILPVPGQIIMGLLIDGYVLFSSSQSGLEIQKVMEALLVIA